MMFSPREVCNLLQYFSKKKGICYFVLRIACNVRLSAIFVMNFCYEKNVQFLDRIFKQKFKL